MENTHILFVINPKSGGINKDGLDKLIKRMCDECQSSYAFHYTTGKNDVEAIKQLMKEKSPEIVVACGGDGTVNIVAQCLLHTEISLGIMPMGSANGLASELNIPEDDEESLQIIFSNKTKPLDVLRINEAHISLHLSDVGFNANMIKEFEKESRRGKLGYAKAFFKSIKDREGATYDIKTDKNQLTVTAEMLVFANASSYGTGAIINPDSELDDGFFELIVFKPIRLSELASLTFESFFGDINESPYVEIYQAKEAHITCKQHQLLQIDGELINEVNEIKLEMLPKAIQLIRV